MNLSNSPSKLNWRLIFVHFIATWFIYHALWQFSYLSDYPLLEKIGHLDYTGSGKETVQRMSMLTVMTVVFRFAGIFIGFGISLWLSLKNKWNWINSVIVLLISSACFFLDRFYYSSIRFIFDLPGRVFKSDWDIIVTNGLIMLIIGMVIFLMDRSINYINKSNIKKAPIKGKGKRK